MSIMEIHRMKPENPIIIVDEAEFERIDSIAKLKEEEVEKLAEEKFRDYLNDGMNPIKLELKIRGVEGLIGHSVISELNYGERGYPMSVPEEIKYAIVDDITGYVEKKFEHYKDDCQALFDKIYRSTEERNKKKIRFWQSLFIVTFFILLVECICRTIQ